MAISRKLLSEGEYVVLSVRAHGKVLIWPIVVLVLVMGALITALTLEPGSELVALGAVVVAAIMLVAWSLVPILKWMSSTYTITNRRLITRHGVLTRSGRDIPLFRINDVSYQMGLLDRLLGCGTLMVSDATEKDGMVLPDIPRVEQFQLQISDRLFANDHGSDQGSDRIPGEPRNGG
jgi:membrane protein YdbS with pleckstrin-like domain